MKPKKKYPKNLKTLQAEVNFKSDKKSKKTFLHWLPCAWAK